MCYKFCHVCLFETDIDESLKFTKCNKCGETVCELCVNKNGVCDNCKEEEFEFERLEQELICLKYSKNYFNFFLKGSNDNEG